VGWGPNREVPLVLLRTGLGFTRPVTPLPPAGQSRFEIGEIGFFGDGAADRGDIIVAHLGDQQADGRQVLQKMLLDQFAHGGADPLFVTGAFRFVLPCILRLIVRALGANDVVVAHFLFEDGAAARQALEAAGIRVLEEREVTRIGGMTAVKIDIRLITATNEDLEQAIADHRFREDLYYRIHVVPIYLPPLRERREAPADSGWALQ